MAHSRESPCGRGRRRRVITRRLASMIVASRNSLSASSSLTSPISRRYSRTLSVSESSAATWGFLRSSGSSSRSSFSCCTSILISGSPTSSPSNTSSLKPFSSFNLPLEFFVFDSCHSWLLARGSDGLALVLRFSFCDDLFFTVMEPFLPDDITYELLRLNSGLYVIRHVLQNNSPSYCNRFEDSFLYA